MSTRSTVEFQSDRTPLVSVYQHSDGYPSVVGKELYEFLSDFNIVNGIPFGNDIRMANGAGCLAAQFIADSKDDVGGLYINPLGDRQEFNYIVNVDFDTMEVDITVCTEFEDHIIFKGNVEEFGIFCEEDET